MNPCERKCYDCKNVAIHEDSILPWVLCKKCGSDDTRLVKPTPEMQKIIEEQDFAQVGALLAKCEAVHLFKHAQTGEWITRVDIGDDHRTRTGPTQLAAIRAAVEAAEKGVRE